MSTWWIKGASPYGERVVDLLLTDGVITDIDDDLSTRARELDAIPVDAAGLIALPGFVDIHTHLREPGREDAETIRTGSQAAALGGYTAVCAMPNTDPIADNAIVVEHVARIGREVGLVDVQPIGAVTVGQRGEQLADLSTMAKSGARVRMFSDDGHCVADPLLMRRALEYVSAFGGVVAQHAEDPRLTEGAQLNDGEVAARLGLPGWPAAAEETIIARDVLLASYTGARLHICHVSTAGSVGVIAWAKSQGWPVTAEVTPHHLLLTDEKACGYDPVFKVNPPLRTDADIAALREALASGVIDAVATDHAPHAAVDKECEWQQARPGMLGLETALGVVVETLVKPGKLDWRGVADRMSVAPARIAGLTGHGHEIEVGAPANLTLVDPDAETTVDPARLASIARNTPYAGMTLPSRVVATFLRGRATVQDGAIVGVAAEVEIVAEAEAAAEGAPAV